MTATAAPRTGSSTVRRELVGTMALVRLAWRRDRILIPASALGLTILSVGSAKATLELFPTATSVQVGLADLFANPAISALYGPIADPTPDAMAVIKTIMLGAVGLGILAYAIVRRHTRTEEEEGRFELLGSGVVGRWAPLTAAVLLSTIAVLVISGLTSLGLASLGMDPVGSLAVGAAWTVSGLFMIGVTAVAAQLTATARGCAGISFGVLAAAFLVRAMGDTATSDAGKRLSWFSPLGWSIKVAAYGANRIWLILPTLALAGALVAAAYALLERRDLGAGLLAGRPGTARAGRLLGSPWGLSWRLNRPSVIGWTVLSVVLSAVLGNLVKSIGDLTSNPTIQQMLQSLGGSAGTLEDIFFSTELRFAAAAATAAGISAALRMTAEERATHAEVLLATPTSRSRFFTSHAVAAALLSTWIMAVIGLVAGVVGHGLDASAPGAGELLVAAVATLPAVWLIIGSTLLLHGLGTRWAPFGWGVLAVTFLLGEFGPLMNLPQWMIDLSPYVHLSQLPGGSFATTPSVVMTALAVLAVIAGGALFRHRDIG
jgi:ABC-2 type transport system permease protein